MQPQRFSQLATITPSDRLGSHSLELNKLHECPMDIGRGRNFAFLPHQLSFFDSMWNLKHLVIKESWIVSVVSDGKKQRD
jgi:hypothetical protein